MKKKSMFLLIVLSIALCGPVGAKDVLINESLNENIAQRTLLYFKALQDGDINTIKQFLSHDIYYKNRVLLEQNKSYSEFLRNYYKNIVFKVKKIVANNNFYIVHVAMQSANGKQSIIHLRLQPSMDNFDNVESWKIEDLIEDFLKE